jgi:hypothetical protein
MADVCITENPNAAENGSCNDRRESNDALALRRGHQKVDIPRKFGE